MTVVLCTLSRQQDTSPLKKRAPHAFLSSIDADTHLTSRLPTNLCSKPVSPKWFMTHYKTNKTHPLLQRFHRLTNNTRRICSYPRSFHFARKKNKVVFSVDRLLPQKHLMTTTDWKVGVPLHQRCLFLAYRLAHEGVMVSKFLPIPVTGTGLGKTFLSIHLRT